MRPSHFPGAVQASAVALAVIFLSSISIIACDPGHDVTFRNDTQGDVSVVSNGETWGSLAPGEQRAFGVLTYEGSRTYSAEDQSGRILFRAEYTWDDLKRMDWEIVITED